MERDFYTNRLDKAKEMLMAGRKEDPNAAESEHKKKKKHKDDRHSHSRSRDKKKRSRSEERKHKKEHKHKERKEHKESRERREHREQRDPRDSRDRKERKEHKESRDHKDIQDKPQRIERDRGDRERQDKYRSERDRGDRDRVRNDRDRDDRQRGGDRSRGGDRERGGDRDRGGYRGDRDRGGYGGDRGGRDGRDRRRQQVEKDPYFEARRQIEQVRKTNPDRAQQMQNDLQKQMIFHKKEKEVEEAKQKFQEAQKEMEEAKREDHTILVYCLPLKAKEKDIWNFFCKANCGKIRDIRIIKDARSGRSKGVAYVEFYTSEAVQKALMMTDRPFQLKGREFMGLRVQHSQAEKNRAAAAARQMRVIKPIDPIEQQQQTLRRQTKVVVGGLVDNLAEMQQSQLKQLFEPFGQIQYVDIHRDPQTGKCKGFAFIQYALTDNAKAAVKAMNGLQIRKQKISVQTISVTQKGQISAGDEYMYSAGSKQNLMNKLGGGGLAPSYSNLQRPPISTVTTPYLIMTNMFKMEGTTPHFFDELKKEITKEVEVYGTVERIFIEKNNQGNIWIKYSDTASAIKAQESMNGKFFDTKKIFCYFVTQNTYQNRVGI